jgi:hypothetical protein
MRLTKSGSNCLEYSKVLFRDAKRPEFKRLLQLLPVKTYLAVEAGAQLLKSRCQRFLKRCVRILFDRLSRDQQGD